MAGGKEHDSRPAAGFDRSEYTINGVKTVVYSAGQGRPVVYWHGAGTFHGIDFARAWTRRFKVILPYHPGYGESGDAPAGYAINDYLLHYLELFEQLNLGQFDLIGMSLGGWLAAEFAVAYGNRLRRLVLVAPAGLNVPEHPVANLAAIPPGEIFSWLVNDLRVLQPYLPKPGEDATHFNAQMAREGQSTARLAPTGPFNPKLDYWLHRVKMPTLLVWPKQDRLLPVGQSRKWMQRLPNARLEIIENAGHLVLDESERAREVVADFLSETTPMRQALGAG